MTRDLRGEKTQSRFKKRHFCFLLVLLMFPSTMSVILFVFVFRSGSGTLQTPVRVIKTNDVESSICYFIYYSVRRPGKRQPPSFFYQELK